MPDDIATFQPFPPDDKNMDVDRLLFTGVPPIEKRYGDTEIADRAYPERPITPAEQPDEIDVDAALWTGYTPTPFVEAPEGPWNAPQPDIPTSRMPPIGTPPFYGMLVQRDCPPWQCPSVWGWPLEVVGRKCIPWCATEEIIVCKEAMDTQLFLLTGVSYEFDQSCVNDNDTFLVKVYRDNQPLAQWTDMVIDNANPDPAHRYLFGGHLNPMDITLRIDFNQTLAISITYLGPLTAPCTTSDPFNCEATVLTRGFVTTLRDRRQGAPKFVSTGPRENDDPDLEHFRRLTTRHFVELERHGL